MFCFHDYDRLTKETENYRWTFKYCIKCFKWTSQCEAKVSEKMDKAYREWVAARLGDIRSWKQR
jgi:hypothetical protein